MSDPSWTDITTAVGTGVIALGTIALAGAAIAALTGWKSALKSQRADECVSAARDLIGSLNSCLRIKAEENLTHMDRVWGAYDRLWVSWRRFDQAFSPARRYHPTLATSIPRDIAHQLNNLRDLLPANWGSTDSVAAEGGKLIRQKVEEFLKPVEFL
jgi:hypothetical protein